MVPDNATIVTCSYSTAVLEALASASRGGKQLRVLLLESRVGDVAYGHRMADALTLRGVEATVVDDDADLASHGPVTLGLIGADRVGPDGSLVNGIPSLALANSLFGAAPLYVVCETFKLDDGEQLEDGFDVVPAKLVAGYVTDRGMPLPPQVWALRQSSG